MLGLYVVLPRKYSKNRKQGENKDNFYKLPVEI